MYVVVRTRDNASVSAAVRDALRRADPRLSLFDVKSMLERVATSLRYRKAAMVLCVIFAGLALVLSAIGI
jgi:hypothetical protein